MLLELNYYYGNEVEHNGDRKYPRLYPVSLFQHSQLPSASITQALSGMAWQTVSAMGNFFFRW